MIITEFVATKWNPNTKEHFMNRGYIFTKHKDEFVVKVEDLVRGSSVIIEVKCDYCPRVQKKEYGVINASIVNSIIRKYSCNDCKGLKTIEENNEKQKRGFLKRGDKSYWRFRENRISELHQYLSVYGCVDGMTKIDHKLYESIIKYDGSLRLALENIGYDWDQISSASSTNHNKDFNNVRIKIEKFIIDNDRFPLWEEMTRNLKIQIKDISFHGGIAEIKRKINYSDESSYVDDRGYLNKSGIEYIVAQFLIKNNISYKRDEQPFRDRKYTCDFYFEGSNGEPFYVEVWGYRKRDVGVIGNRYNKSKVNKIHLYNDNKLNLISINYEDTQRMTFDEIQDYLKEKLSYLTGKDLRVFEDSSFLRPNKLTDEEILNTIMKYSEEENELPPQRLLHQAGLSSYLKEIRKRHKGYYGFALAFNKKLSNHATVKIS